MIQHICFLFPLTTMYLDFPSFAFNPMHQLQFLKL